MHFFVKKSCDARKFGASRDCVFFCRLENLQTVEHMFLGHFEHKIVQFFYFLDAEDLLSFLSFFSRCPKSEKWTYRFGCALRSVSSESAETTVASMWL